MCDFVAPGNKKVSLLRRADIKVTSYMDIINGAIFFKNLFIQLNNKVINNNHTASLTYIEECVVGCTETFF
jgi:hypothetical protein